MVFKMFRRIISLLILSGLLFLTLNGCTKSVDAKVLEEKLALANKYVLEQKYEEAILTFQEIIKIDPKLVKPYIGIAHVYLLEGKTDPAEKTLQDAIQVVDDKNSIQMGLGNIYIEEQKYDQAEKTFLTIIDKDTKYQDAYEGLAQVYQAQSKVDKVIDILNQAIKNNPGNPKNYSFLATAYVQKGDKAKALEMVKTSLKINTDENYEVFDALGNIYGQDWGGLITEGDKLLAVDPKDKTGAIFKFYGLFNTGEYQKALDFYQTVQDSLKNGKIRVDVALSFYRLGDKDKAKSVINSIDLNNIKNESFLINLINYFTETGDKDKAIELAKKGLLLDKKIAEFYLLLYQLTGDKQFLARMQTLGSSLDKVYYTLGLAAENQQEWEKAIDNFSKAISLNPSIPEYFYERGNSKISMNEKFYEQWDKDLTQKGLDDFLTAFDKGLVTADSYAMIGSCYLGLKQDEKAIPYYEKSCTINPSNSSYYSKYSFALLGLHRPSEALSKASIALQKAQTNSDKSVAYRYIGRSYKELKRYDEALNSFNKELEYADDSEWKASAYIWDLAGIYTVMNQPALAKQALLKGKEVTKMKNLLQSADEQLKNL